MSLACALIRRARHQHGAVTIEALGLVGLMIAAFLAFVLCLGVVVKAVMLHGLDDAMRDMAAKARAENATLAERAQSTLDRLGYHAVAVVQGALAAGHEPEAPYDVIIIEGGVETVPEPLLDQLKEGGRLVAVEGAGNAGIAKVYLKIDGLTSARRAFNAAVKPLPGFERTPEFEF